MKKIIKAFIPFIKEILCDFMLIACIIAPILMGVFFKFILPILETMLCEYFKVSNIITPYYPLFDLLLAIMTPTMFSFSGAIVMLSELDNGTAKYLVVTPLQKKGYFISRLLLPTIIAFIYNIILLLIFTIANSSILNIIIYSIFGVCSGVLTSLFVVSLAKNKVEGMALSKLSGFFGLGLPIAYFIKTPVQYISSFLPSFWLAKFQISNNYFHLIATTITILIWASILYKKYTKRFE